MHLVSCKRRAGRRPASHSVAHRVSETAPHHGCPGPTGRPCLQVLQGLNATAWGKVQQVVAEVHSDALLEQVTAALRQRFAHVVHEQGERMRGTQLYMVYATQPTAPR